MSPKHFFAAESDQGISNLDSRTGGEAITVMSNFPGKPDCQELFLGISMDWSGAEPGEAWGAVDADKLRDAIDKAVGPREAKPWEGSKPYRPIDRDRLLRHIEDVEAALTRRNERHEQDQERIRELEGLLARQEAEIYDLQQPKTAREHLDLAWEAAVVPEDGMIHAGEEYVLQGISGRVEGPLRAGVDWHSVTPIGPERRLLEPRPEPAKEDLYRKDLESKGLAEWEIELLVEAAA